MGLYAGAFQTPVRVRNKAATRKNLLQYYFFILTLSMQEVADKVSVPASCALHRRQAILNPGWILKTSSQLSAICCC